MSAIFDFGLKRLSLIPKKAFSNNPIANDRYLNVANEHRNLGACLNLLASVMNRFVGWLCTEMTKRII